MKWVKEKPSKLGWYAIRKTYFDICKIEMIGKVLPGTGSGKVMLVDGKVILISTIPDNIEFYGPIKLPE